MEYLPQPIARSSLEQLLYRMIVVPHRLEQLLSRLVSASAIPARGSSVNNSLSASSSVTEPPDAIFALDIGVGLIRVD
jgi:hypothetical protein